MSEGESQDIRPDSGEASEEVKQPSEEIKKPERRRRDSRNSPEETAAGNKWRVNVLLELGLGITLACVWFVGWLAMQMGVFFNLIGILLFCMAPTYLFILGYDAGRGSLTLWPSQIPRIFWFAAVNRALFFILCGLLFSWAVVPIQFEESVYTNILWLICGCAGVTALLGFVPRTRIRLATQYFYLVGSGAILWALGSFLLGPNMDDAVTLRSPFRGPFYIIQGGASSVFNHHYAYDNQRHALDIVASDGSYLPEGILSESNLSLLDYPTYGAQLVAPCDGKVVEVDGQWIDFEPSSYYDSDEGEEQGLAGNYVIIERSDGKYVFLVHLKHQSIEVLVGDEVVVGQPLAAVGNTGNSTGPHLHIQVQSHIDFDDPSCVTFPIQFENLKSVNGTSIPSRASTTRYLRGRQFAEGE